MNYDPVESLREEVDRFKATNRFTPMLVTNFYIQAGLVLKKLDAARVAIRNYGSHTDYCFLNHAEMGPPTKLPPQCDCGFQAAKEI